MSIGRDAQECSTCSKQNKTAREILHYLIRERSFDLDFYYYFWSKTLLKMLLIKNPENQNSEIAANTSEAGNLMK